MEFPTHQFDVIFETRFGRLALMSSEPFAAMPVTGGSVDRGEQAIPLAAIPWLTTTYRFQHQVMQALYAIEGVGQVSFERPIWRHEDGAKPTTILVRLALNHIHRYDRHQFWWAEHGEQVCEAVYGMLGWDSEDVHLTLHHDKYWSLPSTEDNYGEYVQDSGPNEPPSIQMVNQPRRQQRLLGWFQKWFRFDKSDYAQPRNRGLASNYHTWQ
jgi:hypothetical protein